MTDDDVKQVRDQILSIIYQLKKQGVDPVSLGQVLVLMGMDEDSIEEEKFDIMLSMSEENEVIGELALARLCNNIH